MANKPHFDAAAKSSDEYQGLFLSGIPAYVSYGNRLSLQLPEITTYAVNQILDLHVTSTREVLAGDEQYAELAPYYDVTQGEDFSDAPGLTFGFFNVPAHLQEKATALEYGDTKTPPQGFVRSTLFKEAAPLSKQISNEMDSLMGEVVVSRG